MILVTGTKRSGTSLWMQILRAGGFPVFGEAFPRRWGVTLRAANREGFYESLLREGIYHRTNPHPRTGDYFFPEQVVRHVVKVFIPGVIRTDRAFIGHVVATLRDWREQAASLRRLERIEDASRPEPARSERPRMPPELEWWNENYCLIRDVVTRRYAFHVVSYDAVITRPRETIAAVFGWLGSGDPEAAAAVVNAELRTQQRPEVETELPGSITKVFDRLYEHVDAGTALERVFVDELNRANRELAPRIAEHRRALRAFRRRRRLERDLGDGS
jgi:hypothetical protein